MSNSRMTNSFVAGGRTIAGLFLFAALLAAGAAFAAGNPGDEMPFREGEAMPPAPTGMTWCLVQKPAVYDTVSDTVVVRPKANFQVPVPGEYSSRTETVPTVPAHRVGRAVPVVMENKTMNYVAQEGYEVLEVIPPQFTDTTMEVEVCPAHEQITVVPAVFRDSSRRIMISPAKRTFERIACDSTNLCWTACETPEQYTVVATKELVADAREERTPVPARTQQVTVRKIVKPAEVRRVSVPAKSGSYQAAFVAAPPRVDWQAIPAESKDVTVQVESKAPSLANQSLPEKTETISRRVLVQPEQLVWRLQSSVAYAANTKNASCYATGSKCAVAQYLPYEIPHTCDW